MAWLSDNQNQAGTAFEGVLDRVVPYDVDLIGHAGRLKRTANLTLEVYRVLKNGGDSPLAVPEIHSIRVDSAYLRDRNADKIYSSYIPGFTVFLDRAVAFKLRPYDRVVVRSIPHPWMVVGRRRGS